jgi:hypothetical protein
MLTILHPEILPVLAEYSGGLIPLEARDGVLAGLILKIPKEEILAARINQGFKVYVVPLTLSGIGTVGLVSAFVDDADEPRVVMTPLLDDHLTYGIVRCLLSDHLTVHIFDEHNRELLGYGARTLVPPKTRQLLEQGKWLPLTKSNARAALDQIGTAFSERPSEAESAAFEVKFLEALMPEDVAILDTRPEQHKFRGSAGISMSSLLREEPGPAQELDIAFLLQRIFGPEHIYLNPRKTTNGKELADVLVVTERVILILQAKDSPNTPEGLGTTLERKRKKTLSSLKDAIRQVRRTAQYISSQNPVEMTIEGEVIRVPREGRAIAALIVVKELFPDQYDEYTPPVLDLSDYIDAPCIVLDYPELHAYTQYLNDEAGFFRAFMRVYHHGAESGRFPRLRFGLADEQEN